MFAKLEHQIMELCKEIMDKTKTLIKEILINITKIKLIRIWNIEKLENTTQILNKEIQLILVKMEMQKLHN